MAQSLVIVESPAKARTINRYLGREYVVRSSVGHIRDLPAGGRSARSATAGKRPAPGKRSAGTGPEARKRAQMIRNMGVDPDAGWAANYEVLPGKEKVVAELSRLAEKFSIIYLATDLDREGEAIAWHLQEAIGGPRERYRRVVFNEITRKAVRAAFESPTALDMNQVNAQQARRFLDRVVGFELSPLLWAKVARNLSAGRVQSVAVRLVLEREREIRAFDPEEYWEVFADLNRSGRDALAEPLRFQVVKEQGSNFRPGDQAAADAAVARLRESRFEVAGRTDKPTRVRPNPPFITSTLQQVASSRLGFPVKKTMSLAQRLYEAGYITYMRTDATSLSGGAVAACREWIANHFDPPYLPEAPRFYRSRANAQEAHEAIRPTDVSRDADALTGVTAQAARLYDLIWRQFLACQMTDAEYLASTIQVRAGEFELRIRGRVQQFDGFTRVLPPASRGEDQVTLPADLGANAGGGEAEVLDLRQLEPVQHFTRPPPRYGEASLVRELEKRGIGRPSTYAAIISTIQERGYVSLANRRFHAEKIGELVTDRLVEQFANLMDYGFTAQLEQELDRIAEGGLPWRQVLDTFYKDFQGKLQLAYREEAGMRANLPMAVDIACPDCGRPMQFRTASTGEFLGCSGYRLPPKERCSKTMNLLPGEEALDSNEDADTESRQLRARRKCPLCGKRMTSYLVDAGRKLHVCADSPDCAGHEVESGAFRIKGYDGPVLVCDKCGAQMQLKTGRFGKFFGCTSCSNTRKLLRNGQPAPPKADPVPMPELRCQTVDDHYLLRDGASGVFLAASRFPKHRETRAPTVSELLPHANELDAKFKYLLRAPTEDAEGRPAVIRFNRKTGQQYVRSENDGKATGWQALYRDGAWVETKASEASGKARAKRAPARRKRAKKTD